jgi:hypothetical protein
VTVWIEEGDDRPTRVRFEFLAPKTFHVFGVLFASASLLGLSSSQVRVYFRAPLVLLCEALLFADLPSAQRLFDYQTI